DRRRTALGLDRGRWLLSVLGIVRHEMTAALGALHLRARRQRGVSFQDGLARGAAHDVRGHGDLPGKRSRMRGASVARSSRIGIRTEPQLYVKGTGSC